MESDKSLVTDEDADEDEDADADAGGSGCGNPSWKTEERT